jgi:hypothetical protein
MKRILMKVWDVPGNAAVLPALIFLCICFIIGAITGSVVAANGGDSAQLASMIADFTVLSDVNFWNVLLNILRFPVIVILCGLCVFGTVMIPIVVAVRGFLLLFTITTFVRLFGGSGLLYSMSLFGIQCLFVLPCILLLAAQGLVSASLLFSLASSRGKKISGSVFSGAYFIRILICFGVLLFCALVETLITPYLVSLTINKDLP